MKRRNCKSRKINETENEQNTEKLMTQNENQLQLIKNKMDKFHIRLSKKKRNCTLPVSELK